VNCVSTLAAIFDSGACVTKWQAETDREGKDKEGKKEMKEENPDFWTFCILGF
jgi:hypothetical protein